MKKNLLWLMLVSVFLTACAPAAESVSDPQAAVQTMVAATVAALPTRTSPPPTAASPASATPSRTLAPTWTPFPSLTPFPSFTPPPTPLASATLPLVGGAEMNGVQGTTNFSCFITKQKPEDWEVYPPSGRNLVVVWTVRNVGLKDWNNDEVTIDFRGGERMVAKGTTPQLLEPIPAGETGIIVLNFILPTVRNRYVSRWALMRGRDPFCEFTFQVTIK
ncbi:MAG: hypothetical protein OHK0031_18450 [Anaerolineales bacterium]